MQFINSDYSDKLNLIRRLLLFFPLFAIVNIVIVYLFTDISELLKIREFYPGYLLIAIALRLVPWFFKALRLQNWMRFLQQDFSYREGLRISVWSELGAAVTPTAIAPTA